MKRNVNYVWVFILTLLLTACGGGGGSGSSESTNTSSGGGGTTGSVTTEAPKVVSFTVDSELSCTATVKCENIITVEVDAEITGAKFQLNGAQADIVLSDSFLTIPESGEITFDSAKTFKLNVTSQTAGEISIELVAITDANGTYDIDDTSAVITFDEQPVQSQLGTSRIYFNPLNDANLSSTGEQDENTVIASKITVTRYKRNDDGEYVQESKDDITLDSEHKFEQQLAVGEYYEHIAVSTSFAELETSRQFSISRGGLANNFMMLNPVGVTAEEVAAQKEAHELGEHNLFTYYDNDFTFNWVDRKPLSVKYDAELEFVVNSFSLVDSSTSGVEILSNLNFNLKVKDTDFNVDITPGSQIHDFVPLSAGTVSIELVLSNFTAGNQTLELDMRIAGAQTIGGFSDTAVEIEILE
ncbi:hypothetical protein [Pseudoalteromonas sp. C12FD-1]|uniref:hypothetical protein n=1 Tax=Pseudoalteromonas sp. C12FD-1 TaxID=3131979 RepID=UPI00307D683A